MENRDETVDVLVVGTGAGAMTAALSTYDQGGKVLLIEKGEQYGGSSAMSGGGLWVPCNHLALEAGIQDTVEEAWEYMHNCVKDDVPEYRQRFAPGDLVPLELLFNNFSLHDPGEHGEVAAATRPRATAQPTRRFP